MDNFDLRKYLTENKINESFFYKGDKTFLDNIYVTQEDFNRDVSKFADLIDAVTDVPNSIFHSGNILGNSDIEFSFEELKDEKYIKSDGGDVDGWDIFYFLMDTFSIRPYFDVYDQMGKAESDERYIEYKKEFGDISYEDYIENVIKKMEGEIDSNWKYFWNNNSPKDKKRED